MKAWPKEILKLQINNKKNGKQLFFLFSKPNIFFLFRGPSYGLFCGFNSKLILACWRLTGEIWKLCFSWSIQYRTINFMWQSLNGLSWVLNERQKKLPALAEHTENIIKIEGNKSVVFGTYQ
jgi:hypothetical protein